MPRISVITSLYRCYQYLDNYFDAVDKIINLDECEFLLLFNDPTEEEDAKIKERIAGKNHFKYYKIDREPLYATWNRGIKLASGKYCANWNVDDIRLPDSLFRQANALDDNPKCALAYGNTINILRHEDTTGTINNELDYSETTKHKFRDSCFLSCFPMWRKSIHDTIGYFDEQFKVVGDFEFQIRVAYKYPFVKVDGILGYFFIGSGGARLSQQNKMQIIENNMTYLRYGVYQKVDITYLSQRHMFNENEVVSYNQSIPLTQYIPYIQSVRKSKKGAWVKAILFKLPYDTLRYIKIHILRIPTRNS